MKTIKELLNIIPQIGTVEWMGIRPQKREDVEAVNEVWVSAETGLEGDHYSMEGGKRMVTLIQSEHLEAVANILGRAYIDPALVRRNIVVSGINLHALHNQKIRIGDDLILMGTGQCHPCSRMEINLGEGGYNALRGHGGITAKVIKGGKIEIGNQVHFIPSEEGSHSRRFV